MDAIFGSSHHNTGRTFIIKDYTWKENKRGNLEGRDIISGKHVFTWQPHGSQFTILYDVPASAKRFTIKRPTVLDPEKTLETIGFDQSWVTILQ
jgi:uncharacterized protein with WD repeat